MFAHGATPCLRPPGSTAFRLAPHPAERDSAGHGLADRLRCARAAASVGSRGALLNEMQRPKDSSGPMKKVISRYKVINR